jgi:hypothetical protein
VTLFRDQRQEEYDNKDWFFILEDVKVIYYRFLIYTNFYYGSHCVKTYSKLTEKILVKITAT